MSGPGFEEVLFTTRAMRRMRPDPVPEAELRSKHAECLELETEVSYVRRLTQARIDILEAELDRRASGRTLGDLIDDLPRILADSGPRGNPATSRIPQQMAPEHESEWAPELARFDGILANVTLIGDDEVRGAIEGLRGLEREGRLGRVHDAFYTTTGNGTPVVAATRFGQEIAGELRDAGVQAVLLSGT